MTKAYTVSLDRCCLNVPHHVILAVSPLGVNSPRWRCCGPASPAWWTDTQCTGVPCWWLIFSHPMSSLHAICGFSQTEYSHHEHNIRRSKFCCHQSECVEHSIHDPSLSESFIVKL